MRVTSSPVVVWLVALPHDCTPRRYGGAVFGYSATSVRVWVASGTGASPVHVGDGWRGAASPLSSPMASVRVKAWRSGAAPDFATTTPITANDDAEAFKEVTHGLGVLPGRVQVLVQPSAGANAG